MAGVFLDAFQVCLKVLFLGRTCQRRIIGAIVGIQINAVLVYSLIQLVSCHAFSVFFSFSFFKTKVK